MMTETVIYSREFFYVKELYESGAFEQLTENSIVDPQELQGEFEDIREQGWSFDDEEFMDEVCCVAAPVRDGSGAVIASISISALKTHLSRK